MNAQDDFDAKYVSESIACVLHQALCDLFGRPNVVFEEMDEQKIITVLKKNKTKAMRKLFDEFIQNDDICQMPKDMTFSCHDFDEVVQRWEMPEKKALVQFTVATSGKKSKKIKIPTKIPESAFHLKFTKGRPKKSK